MRTVAVELVAKVQVYKREMDSAGKSTKGFKEELQDSAKAGDATASANETVARSTKRVGEESRKTAKDVKTLSREMFELEIKTRNAAKELKRTGDMDLDLAATLRRNQSQLRALTKLRKELLGLGESDDDGRNPGGKLISQVVESFSNAMSRGGTTFVGAVVGAVALAAPFIGASIAAAVAGTAGLGGIAGGIAMASRDPRVKDAAANLAEVFMGGFGRATQSFTAPTIAALHQLELVSIDVADQLRPDFADLAAHVEPLAMALRGMVDKTLPGFKDALQSGLVVLGALERALPELGDDLSDMFESFSKNPEASAAAMHDLLMIVGETARAVGTLTHFLSSYYEVLIKVGAVTTGWANDMPKWIKQITPLAAVADYFDQAEGAMKDAANAAPDLADNLGDVGQSAEDAALEMRSLSDAIDDFLGLQLNADQAAVNWRQSLRDLYEELRDGKRTLKENSEAGDDNRESILRLIGEANRWRDITFKQTGDLQAANTQYQANIQTLYDMAKALGFSRQELDLLFAPYINGPRVAVNEFKFPGLDAGISKVRLLQNMARDARLDYATRNRWGGVYERRWGGIDIHAQTGVLRDAQVYSTASPARYAFAEPATGGEAFVPRFGDTARSMGILSQAASWYGASVVRGGGTQTVVHEHRHTVVIQGREMISGFRREVELSGGKADNLIGRKRT